VNSCKGSRPSRLCFQVQIFGWSCTPPAKALATHYCAIGSRMVAGLAHLQQLIYAIAASVCKSRLPSRTVSGVTNQSHASMHASMPMDSKTTVQALRAGKRGVRHRARVSVLQHGRLAKGGHSQEVCAEARRESSCAASGLHSAQPVLGRRYDVPGACAYAVTLLHLPAWRYAKAARVH
jgi:hypothetical protein